MAIPILSLGGDKWAIKESGLLGYNKLNDNYLANEFVYTRSSTSRLTNKQGFIEDSCYNLTPRSEELDNAAWQKANTSIIPNAIIAPNGTLTADKIVENTLNSQHYTYNTGTGTPIIAGVTYTQSVYVKAGERTFVRYGTIGSVFGATTRQLAVDLTNGSVLYNGTGSHTIQYIGDGWYRLSITAIAIANGAASNYIEIDTTHVVGGQTYTGDGVSGIYAWGSQLVQGTDVRPYLKTTTRLHVPKIDYSYQGKPMMLSEPQRTNINLWSEDFTQSNWAKTLTTITLNTNANPFGINKSYTLTEDNTTGLHFLSQATSVTSGTTYTSSFYVKKNNHSWIQFVASTTTFPSGYWVNFNFDTGLFGNNGGSGTWAAKQLINGYWLITTTNTAISTASNSHCVIASTGGVDTTLRLPGYLGTNSNICDVAAIQFEAGSNATTYIPTTTATVTRNQDWSYHDLFTTAALNQNNFTLYVEGYLYNGNTGNKSVVLSDTTATAANSNDLGFYDGIRGIYCTTGTAFTGGVLQTNMIGYYKFIVQRNGTAIKYFRNGIQVWTTQTVPVFNYRYLAINNGGSTYTVSKLDLYNETLADEDCINMTIL